MLDALLWTLIITAGVLSALVLFDGTITIAYKVRGWLEDRR